MKKTKRTIEGRGIIIKTNGDYRFLMWIGGILQSLKGKEIVRVSEEAKNLTELNAKLRESVKRRVRELGIIDHIINLDPELFYSREVLRKF